MSTSKKKTHKYIVYSTITIIAHKSVCEFSVYTSYAINIHKTLPLMPKVIYKLLTD